MKAESHLLILTLDSEAKQIKRAAAVCGGAPARLQTVVTIKFVLFGDSGVLYTSVIKANRGLKAHRGQLSNM